MTWFDTRRGRESAYMAGKDGSFWEEYTLAENENVNQFVSPLVLNDSDSLASKVLTYVWQQTGKNKRNSIVFLAILPLPDAGCIGINSFRILRSWSRKNCRICHSHSHRSGNRTCSRTYSRNGRWFLNR